LKDLKNKDYLVVAFYKFVALDNLDEMKLELKEIMDNLEIRGTVIIASEGINSTISGKREDVLNFLKYLKADSRFADLEYKEALFEGQVFKRTKVKIKREIISLGEPIDPRKGVGKYIPPQDWNDLIQDPEVLVIDTRNDYEVEVGTFKGAINPNTTMFKELPQATAEKIDSLKPKKIAMFCTGGIRCEKYSAFMLQKGYQEVYHLQGGILKYLEEIPSEESLWEGECFVFDERFSVSHETFKEQ
jgi:UPF0176 protein